MPASKDKSTLDKNLESYLENLCRSAKEMGASEAVPIPVADVVVDERVRLKCLVPVCAFYGRNLMCPPGVKPVSDFRNILLKYHFAVLIRTDAALCRPPERIADSNTLSGVWEATESVINGRSRKSRPAEKYFRVLRDDWQKLQGIISRIESQCIADGYPFVAGLSAGGCLLCDVCVGPESGLPCRHPFKARPSMEAMGIDVLATARKAGMQVGFTPDQTRSWVGLILVD